MPRFIGAGGNAAPICEVDCIAGPGWETGACCIAWFFGEGNLFGCVCFFGGPFFGGGNLPAPDDARFGNFAMTLLRDGDLVRRWCVGDTDCIACRHETHECLASITDLHEVVW